MYFMLISAHLLTLGNIYAKKNRSIFRMDFYKPSELNRKIYKSKTCLPLNLHIRMNLLWKFVAVRQETMAKLRAVAIAVADDRTGGYRIKT